MANDLRPRRSLGQNFVADANTVRRIVRLSGVASGDHVVEVGAGLGSLTLALAETGAEVTAVEVDPAVLPVLREQVEPRGVRVVEGDARTLDWNELLGEAGSWSLVANLPYNVAVPLVVRVLEEAPRIASLLVMVQREVGERLAARSGEEAYGAVSVKVAYWAPPRWSHGCPRRSSSHDRRSSRSSCASTVTAPRAGARCAEVAGRARLSGLRPTVRGGPGGLRPPAQDVAPLARRCGRARSLRRSRHRPDRPCRGGVARGVGAARLVGARGPRGAEAA